MINSDSESILKVIKNSIFYVHLKHFDICHHFIRDVITKNELSIGYISGDENSADIFMKSLDRMKHATIFDLIRMT